VRPTPRRCGTRRHGTDHPNDPPGVDAWARNGELLFPLKNFGSGIGGWQVFDSSTGFFLPDGSVLSPDASLVRLERCRTLSPEQQRSFPPFCPDLAVELASPVI
jgi:Uma2 family endonuclease